MRDAGVGPDGLPYSAWQTQRGLWTLYLMLLRVTDGNPLPSYIIDSLMVFLAKKLTSKDLCGAVKELESTRPICLRTASCKILGYVINKSMRHVVSEQVHAAQRGFIKGRNFLNNIVELDCFSRILSRSAPRTIVW